MFLVEVCGRGCCGRRVVQSAMDIQVSFCSGGQRPFMGHRLAVMDSGTITECLSVVDIEQARHPSTLSLLRALPVPPRILLGYRDLESVGDCDVGAGSACAGIRIVKGLSGR